MKLNYREKVILGVFLAIAILLISFFWLVKPKTKAIKDNKAKLSQLNDEKEEIERKILQIPVIQGKIKELYSETNDISKLFVPYDDVNRPWNLDKKMQEYADKNHIRIVSLEANTSQYDELDYFYHKNDDIEEEFRQAADFNGDLQAAYEQQNAESISLDQREVEQLFQTQYGIKCEGTRADLMNYLKDIENIDKAVLINSVKIDDYSFGLNAAKEAGQQIVEVVSAAEEAAAAEGEENTEEGTEAPAEETPAPQPTANGDQITNTSSIEIVLTHYSVIDMTEPDTESIPEADSSETAKK